MRIAIGGMLVAADAGRHEIVPIVHAMAQPSGTIEAETYRQLKNQLVDGVAAALPVDAVVIDTHGAGIVEGIDDLEADLGEALRAVIGPNIPLVTTLDLHGSITEEMNEVFDLMLGVYVYPHVDMFERGVEAIEAVPALVTGEFRPTTHVERLPMLLPTSTTLASPAMEIRQRCSTCQAKRES
jgi:microcystin degradation protein MlrC